MHVEQARVGVGVHREVDRAMPHRGLVMVAAHFAVRAAFYWTERQSVNDELLRTFLFEPELWAHRAQSKSGSDRSVCPIFAANQPKLDVILIARSREQSKHRYDDRSFECDVDGSHAVPHPMLIRGIRGRR